MKSLKERRMGGESMILGLEKEEEVKKTGGTAGEVGGGWAGVQGGSCGP